MIFVLLISPTCASLDHIRRRPDLPNRAGHGFFINEKYISDKDLWSVFGPYIGVEPDHVHSHDDPVVIKHREIHDELHSHQPTHSHTVSSHPVCCQAEIASCLACKHEITLDQYCSMYPFTQGCEGENIVLYEHEVCYEFCPRRTKINYPDKCAAGLVCAPFSLDLQAGGGCGLQAYTCQHQYHFEPETIVKHEAAVADHMLVQHVLGDDWIDNEMEVIMEEMTLCQKIEYKVRKHPQQCNLEHKYIYKMKGCCDKEEEENFTNSPIFYVLVGAGVCCIFMTCAAVGGCAEMQRRKAKRLERRMKRLLNNDRDFLESYWESKAQKEEKEEARIRRYNQLYDELESNMRYPLLMNEVL